MNLELRKFVKNNWIGINLAQTFQAVSMYLSSESSQKYSRIKDKLKIHVIH